MGNLKLNENKMSDIFQLKLNKVNSTTSAYDPQTPATRFFLKEIMQKEFNKCCVDCQQNESTHFDVSFSTFICDSCAIEHEKEFDMFQDYVKPIFGEAWDTFHLEMVKVGGNLRFYQFLKEHGREEEAISSKYTSDEAVYYRKKLYCEAKKIEFDGQTPARDDTEEHAEEEQEIKEATSEVKVSAG